MSLFERQQEVVEQAVAAIRSGQGLVVAVICMQDLSGKMEWQLKLTAC